MEGGEGVWRKLKMDTGGHGGGGWGSEKNERTRILWMAPYIKCRFRRRDISAWMRGKIIREWGFINQYNVMFSFFIFAMYRYLLKWDHHIYPNKHNTKKNVFIVFILIKSVNSSISWFFFFIKNFHCNSYYSRILFPKQY